MLKVQPIYDTRERARAPRESSPYTTRTPTRCRGHSEERKGSNMLRRLTRSPRLRIICRVVVYARRNPARMSRRIISEFGRMAPKCSLICGEDARGLAQTGGTLYEVAPLPLRGIFARTTRRQQSARSAENPSAAWKPINSPDRGKHPMRKTMTAVARDAAIWREHKRRQRSDEHDVMVAEQRRETSPSCAENRCRGEKICSYQKNEASNRTAARSRLFPIQETTWPQGFPPWGRKGAPQQKEAQLCRESRVTRASRRRWGRASR